MRKEGEKMNDISKTMLIPLYMRYIESKKEMPLFVDNTAISIVDSMENCFDQFHYDKSVQLGIAARTLAFDEYVSDFIRRNPEGLVISVGCGLDDRFSRVDNGKIFWINMDLENVINLRQYYIKDFDRVLNIVADITDPFWKEQIQKHISSENVLFVFEGLLYYFNEDFNKELLSGMGEFFTGAEMVFDVISKYYIKFSSKTFSKLMMLDSIKYKWGFESWQKVLNYSPRIKFLDEVFLSDYYREIDDYILETKKNSELRKLFRIGRLLFI